MKEPVYHHPSWRPSIITDEEYAEIIEECRPDLGKPVSSDSVLWDRIRDQDWNLADAYTERGNQAAQFAENARRGLTGKGRRAS